MQRPALQGALQVQRGCKGRCNGTAVSPRTLKTGALRVAANGPPKPRGSVRASTSYSIAQTFARVDLQGATRLISHAIITAGMIIIRSATYWQGVGLDAFPHFPHIEVYR